MKLFYSIVILLTAICIVRTEAKTPHEISFESTFLTITIDTSQPKEQIIRIPVLLKTLKSDTIARYHIFNSGKGTGTTKDFEFKDQYVVFDSLGSKEQIVFLTVKSTAVVNNTLVIYAQDSEGNIADLLIVTIKQKVTSQICKDLTSRYGLSLGANFDFADGLKPNNLYSSINVFLPRMWSAFGIETGIYQNKSISKNDTSSVTSSFVTPYKFDSSIVTTRYGVRSQSLVRSNLGIYMNVSLNILSEEDKSIYLIGYMELRQQTIRNIFTDNFINSDSRVISKSAEPLPPKDISVDSTISSWYYAPGVFLTYQNSTFNWKLKAMPWSIKRSDDDMSATAYIYQFGLLIKNYGIELGGEVRGEYSRKGTEYILFLGKRFCLDKLAEFISGAQP